MEQYQEIDYEARKLDMLLWRFRDGMTNEDIGKKVGEKYGYPISRERVAQIIGRHGVDFRKNWTKDLAATGKIKLETWDELESAPGVRKVWIEDWKNHRHKALSGNPKLSQEFEERAIKILESHGLSGELMPIRHPFSILANNGARIDVRVTHVDVSKFANQRCASPTWQFSNLRPKDQYDFAMMFFPRHGDYSYFVIPAAHIGNRKKNSRIRIPFPRNSRKTSKWQKFHERLDLILNYTV